MIKNVGLALGVSVLAFLAGMWGIHKAMPYLQPEHVEQLTGQASPDSTAVDSLLQAHQSGVSGDSTQTVKETALEIAGLSADSLRRLHAQAAQAQSLQDSLTSLQKNLQQHQAQNDSLVSALSKSRKQAQAMETSDQNAEEISKAFTQIENDDMGNILEFMPVNTLKRLYTKASTRDRSRILQALPPDQAARFLQMMVDPAFQDSLKLGTPLASDSTALTPTNS